MQLTRTNYVDLAEDVVEKLAKDRKGNFKLTTSKIRKLLNMTSMIYNDVINQNGDVLEEDLVERIQYLRMRFAYEAGRDDAVENLVKVGKIQERLKEIGNSKQNCINFCRYMESIVAYHKFNGGKE